MELKLVFNAQSTTTVISGLVAQRLQGLYLYKVVWGSLCSLFLKWDWLERWVLSTPWMRLAGEVGAFHSVNKIGWRGGCFPLSEWDWLERWVLSAPWLLPVFQSKLMGCALAWLLHVQGYDLPFTSESWRSIEKQSSLSTNWELAVLGKYGKVCTGDWWRGA